MGYTEIQSLDADVTIAIGKLNKATGKSYPKSAEGYYLGNRKVENKRGESTLHFLQTESGNLGVWGTTDLDRKLSQVKPGTMVRISFTGKKATPNGDMYVYKVEQDNANSIEVNVDASAPSYVNEDTEDLDSDEAEYEAPPQAASAQLTSAERQAKVQALLSKKNK